jgi:hypothetical protein
MKVPYAKKWQKETNKLRQIALDCGLTEERKWGKPYFTFQKKNVAIVIPLKEACAFSFFKGALLKDPECILQRIGQAQAGRWIKYTAPNEISALSATLKHYIKEAVQIEESGRKVRLNEDIRVRSSRRTPGSTGLRSEAEGGVRSPDTRPKEVVHFPRFSCEAGEDAGRAGGKVRANDPERARIQRTLMTVPKTAQIDFDVAALFDALDVQRRDRGPELARRCQRSVGFARNAQRLVGSIASIGEKSRLHSKYPRQGL